jgi:hypothetical protein
MGDKKAATVNPSSKADVSQECSKVLRFKLRSMASFPSVFTNGFQLISLACAYSPPIHSLEQPLFKDHSVLLHYYRR